MSLFNVNDDTPCGNCGADFADHDYVKDSIDQYRCQHPHQEFSYGYFHGGDPRQFHPDHESCDPKEIENHKAACELADKLGAEGRPVQWDCPSGWEQWGDVVAHVLRAPFGIGTYVAEFEQFFEAREEDDETEDEE